MMTLIILLTAGKINYTWSISCNTNSMYPAINCTSGKPVRVIVNTVSPNETLTPRAIYWYRPDYRLFSIPSMWYVAHRYIGEYGGLYYFNGDNNPTVDPGVERKYIHLKVIKILI